MHATTFKLSNPRQQLFALLYGELADCRRYATV
jgi:hypothetical protein